MPFFEFTTQLQGLQEKNWKEHRISKFIVNCHCKMEGYLPENAIDLERLFNNEQFLGFSLKQCFFLWKSVMTVNLLQIAYEMIFLPEYLFLSILIRFSFNKSETFRNGKDRKIED